MIRKGQVFTPHRPPLGVPQNISIRLIAPGSSTSIINVFPFRYSTNGNILAATWLLLYSGLSIRWRDGTRATSMRQLNIIGNMRRTLRSQWADFSNCMINSHPAPSGILEQNYIIPFITRQLFFAHLHSRHHSFWKGIAVYFLRLNVAIVKAYRIYLNRPPGVQAVHRLPRMTLTRGNHLFLSRVGEYENCYW